MGERHRAYRGVLHLTMASGNTMGQLSAHRRPENPLVQLDQLDRHRRHSLRDGIDYPPSQCFP
jgi:hypothetical protein